LNSIDTMDLEANREKAGAYLEREEPTPEEIKSLELECQEVPKEGAMVETIRALEDQYGDWHLAIGRSSQPKKRT
jgi:hypothetical protein